MNIEILGESHLAETMRRATAIRGFTHHPDDVKELIFVAEDVDDHTDTSGPGDIMVHAVDTMYSQVPVIVVSQVPPGWTRRWGESHPNIFYQVDTIIMRNALDRVLHTEQFIIGCLHPGVPLPLAYQEYLSYFPAPILQMSYESAEFAKMAINYCLTKQIEMANNLSRAARGFEANWEAVEAALRNDKRIGKYAYLRPGEPNQHLMRDVATIELLLRGDDG